jgi:HEAT repeat protein
MTEFQDAYESFEDDGLAKHKRPSIAETIAELQGMDDSKVVSATILYGLSSLDVDEWAQINGVWQGLESENRRRIAQAVAESIATNFDMDYTALGRLLLSDSDAEVRLAALEMFPDDLTKGFLDQLRFIAVNDPSVNVRAEATSMLGQFILAAELEDISPEYGEQAQKTAIEVWQNPNEEIDVRRRGLEAISNSTHPQLVQWIKSAYRSDDSRLQVSAIFAMGSSCDEQWEDVIIRELQSQDSERRYEAARAAGNIGLESALPYLTSLAFEDDVEIRDVSIWSLGEIGGREPVRVLNTLAKQAKKQKDSALLETIEEALANAELESGTLSMFRHEGEDYK